jgi:glycosyltransferase involved in cell wall biosynthesis
MRMSVAIPTYEYKGKGVDLLKHQFGIFKRQQFKDFQVVISDHSIDDDIKNFCEKNEFGLNIKYIRNEKLRGNFSANTNHAIENCDGEIIKVLYQDDFLFNHESLKKISDFFADDINWLLSSCIHCAENMSLYGPLTPRYHDEIYLGNNTIGCPSVLAVKNRDDLPKFDERLLWLMDVDYYKALFDKFGNPRILGDVNVCVRVWDSQLTKEIDGSIKNEECFLMEEKYKK